MKSLNSAYSVEIEDALEGQKTSSIKTIKQKDEAITLARQGGA